MMRFRTDLDGALRAMETKINKIRPEGDIRALQRAIKTKAPLDDTSATLTTHELKIKNFDAILSQINEEMEAFAKALRSTQDFIDVLGFNKSEILAGTKGMNCLVCGRNELGTVILNSPQRRKSGGTSRPPSSGPIFPPPSPSAFEVPADSTGPSLVVTPRDTARGKMTVPSLKKKIQFVRNESVK